MYLTKLNALHPGPNHWPSDVASSTEVMNALFTYADAELNAARWAHQEFESLQPMDRVHPSAYLHRSWTYAVMNTAANNFGPLCAPGQYGCECVAWALINLWIQHRLADTPAYDLPNHMRPAAQQLRKPL
jgi:hypothetical protein